MADIDKLGAAFDRFEGALRQFEAAVSRRSNVSARAAELESETESLRRDQQRLASELNQVRVKAGELVDTSKQAVGKIDAAMSRIRSVLHSNSGT
jgi:DNA anti-recombination protein RmuC